MSAFEGYALPAIALQLASTLEAYERNVRSLAAAPSFDPDLYRRISQQLDAMRMYAADLPPVSVAWVELMIRHFELTHGMWRVQRDGADAADLSRLHAQLEEAADRLAQKCAQMVPRT